MTPFRPRNPDENMTVYLNAKQAYESGSNMNQTPAPQLPQTNPNLGVSYAPGFVPVQPTPTPTPLVTPTPTQTPPTPLVPPTTLIQGSIVDYLNSQGQPSDFNTRAGLAQQYGIQGYSGTAQQNIQLLNSLQGGTQPPKDVLVEGGEEIIQEGEQETLPPEEDYSNSLKTFLSDTYGIDTSNLGADFSDPVASIKKIIEEVMTSTGMPQVKTQMEAIAKAKLDLENKMAEEIASVNDNPWLSEGLRQKKVQAVKDTYETKINNQVNEFNLLQDMYDSAKQESQYAATLATNMYQNNREFLQGQLEFMTNAAEKAASAKQIKLPALAEEYQYAKSQGFTGSFMEYQKFESTQYGTAGLTPQQEISFRTLSNKFLDDKLVQGLDKAIQLNSIAEMVIKDPSSAGNQLMVLYSLVKALDPDSAVREGELTLAQAVQSKWDKAKTSIEQIGEGKLISNAATIELADTIKKLTGTWIDLGNRQANKYKATAIGQGIGDAFNTMRDNNKKFNEEIEVELNNQSEEEASQKLFDLSADPEKETIINGVRGDYPDWSPSEVEQYLISTGQI
jgi:hypothetical protein